MKSVTKISELTHTNASLYSTAHQFALQQVALPCMRYMQQIMAPPFGSASTTSADSEMSKEAKVNIRGIAALELESSPESVNYRTKLTKMWFKFDS